MHCRADKNVLEKMLNLSVLALPDGDIPINMGRSMWSNPNADDWRSHVPIKQTKSH